ncbi:BA14K family protein [Aquibium carbonis]|uniref:Lectin-like protein BA14k n=1 Tax=Aquibium carbonis TaxID=2495581 RepID=A0A3R9YIF5_9HYPH|nr:BA14K family protein [Aquibium carbonis]RST88422.1 BA14K family protein [Aquibium carbonis]
MRNLLAILAAVVLTTGLYGAGFFTAFFFLSAEPTPVWKPNRESASVWTMEPVVVAEDQTFERLPARPVSDQNLAARAEPRVQSIDEQVEPVAADLGSDPVQPVDVEATASVEAERAGARSMSTAHVQWCADRYRSYRIEDNRYTSYQGVSRECISPYLDGGGPVSDVGQQDYVEETASAQAYGLPSSHVQSCFDRYQSYRPSDNSYQPYGGGPRRQCR